MQIPLIFFCVLMYNIRIIRNLIRTLRGGGLIVEGGWAYSRGGPNVEAIRYVLIIRAPLYIKHSEHL